MKSGKWGWVAAGVLALIGAFVLARHWLPPGKAPERIGRPDAAIPGPGSTTRITVMTNAPHLKSAEALGEWFQAETGVLVHNVVVDYQNMLGQALADVASNRPEFDIFMFWYVDLGALVERHALRDLTDFISENRNVMRPEDFIESIYDPYTLCDGRRWAIPYDGDTHVLFYRKSILKRRGLSPPRTWDEYARAARIINEGERAAGVFGTALMAPRIPIIIISSFMNRLSGHGGRLLDENGASALGEPAAVAALADMAAHAALAMPSPLETDWEVSRDAFLSGRVAMVEQWTDIGIMAEDPSQSLIQGDWDVVAMPGVEPGSGGAPALNAGFSLAVSSRAPHPEAAMDFILFAGRPDIALRLNLINGGIDPTRLSVLDAPAYRQFAPRIAAAARSALKGAAPWPSAPRTPALLDVLTEQIILTLEGRRTPAEAMEEADRQWRRILGK